MATKLEKMAAALNENYRDSFDGKFYEQFNIKVTTEYNIFSMELITTRDDKKIMNKDHALWAKAYSDGYHDAMEMVHDAI